MQVVVPMAGWGRRFQRAGYDMPKPLIEVNGRPMIQWVVDLFPGADAVILLCNQEHLDDPDLAMRATLETLGPHVKVHGVPAHHKGPVHTLLQGRAEVDETREVLICMCDLSFPWNFDEFQRFAANEDVDGAIVCYRGFHPHSLNSTNYAHAKEVDGRVVAVREKGWFTDDPIANREPCSNGVYYFRDASRAFQAFEQICEDEDLAISGEYYVSQAYNPLIDDGAHVVVYESEHYFQWGNPRDLEEYLHHHRGFARRMRPRLKGRPLPGTLLVPLAGLGSRFANEGYGLPKPLIEVSATQMVELAVGDLPHMERQVFVLRKDTPKVHEIKRALLRLYPRASFVWTNGPTDGQARTCVHGVQAGFVDLEHPLVIASGDQGLCYDQRSHARAMKAHDLVVWTMQSHPGARRSPEMYGWVGTEGGLVDRVRVKAPLEDPSTDHCIVGAFSFRRARDFLRVSERLFRRQAKVNGEFYVDSAVQDALDLGLSIAPFVVDHYHGWGTPADLKTWSYWQRCFHRWESHPYRVEHDPTLTQAAVRQLHAEYHHSLPHPFCEEAS